MTVWGVMLGVVCFGCVKDLSSRVSGVLATSLYVKDECVLETVSAADRKVRLRVEVSVALPCQRRTS